MTQSPVVPHWLLHPNTRFLSPWVCSLWSLLNLRLSVLCLVSASAFLPQGADQFLFPLYSLSFRSVKAQKDLTRKPVPRHLALAPLIRVRGVSHPADKTSSDPTVVKGCLLLQGIFPRQSTCAEGLHWACLVC